MINSFLVVILLRGRERLKGEVVMMEVGWEVGIIWEEGMMMGILLWLFRGILVKI